MGKRVLVGVLLGLVAGATMGGAALFGIGFAGARAYGLGAATGVLAALLCALSTGGAAAEAAVKAGGAAVLGVGAMWILRHWVPGRAGTLPLAALCIVGAALGAMLAADRRAR